MSAVEVRFCEYIADEAIAGEVPKVLCDFLAEYRRIESRLAAIESAIDWVCSEYLDCPPRRDALETGIRVWIGHLRKARIEE